MTAVDRLLDELRDVVGDDAVVTAADVVAGHVTDWTRRFSGSTPAVVRPGSLDEVAGVVAACRRARVAMVPQGGNTGLVGGSVPLDGEVVVSTLRMDEITDVDPDAGQLSAGAGATLASVQRAATTAGWRYGVDLAARDSATIGGTVATNAGGLRVIRFGSTRHQVLGVEAVLGTGDRISRLGGLRKDNTGYDLAGLLCGSEGTLGIVTKVRLALVPAAGEAVTALVGFTSFDAAVRAAGAVRRSVPGLEAVEVVLRDGATLVAEQTGSPPVLEPVPPVQLLIEAVGPPDPTATLGATLDSLDGVLDAAVATDPVRARQLWHVREAHTEAISRLGVPHKYDVTLPMAMIGEFCATIPQQVIDAAPGARTIVFGHLADGNVHVNVVGGPDAPLEQDAQIQDERIDQVVLRAVIERGGSVSAEHGIGRAKRGWLARDRGPGDVAAMRVVKAALDPDGVCNPAVLFDR